MKLRDIEEEMPKDTVKRRQMACKSCHHFGRRQSRHLIRWWVSAIESHHTASRRRHRHDGVNIKDNAAMTRRRYA